MKKTVASDFVTFVVLEKTLGNVNPGDLTCILGLLTLFMLTFLLIACQSIPTAQSFLDILRMQERSFWSKRSLPMVENLEAGFDG